MKRPCLTCKTPTEGSYCPTHAPRKQTTSASKRGLGWDHQQMAARVLAEEKVCWIDGLPGTLDDPLTADHIIPRSKGGTNHRSNYRAAHASCNSRRGNSTHGYGIAIDVNVVTNPYKPATEEGTRYAV